MGEFNVNDILGLFCRRIFLLIVIILCTIIFKDGDKIKFQEEITANFNNSKEEEKYWNKPCKRLVDKIRSLETFNFPFQNFQFTPISSPTP